MFLQKDNYFSYNNKFYFPCNYKVLQQNQENLLSIQHLINNMVQVNSIYNKGWAEDGVRA